MRKPITQTAAALSPPTAAERAEAARAGLGAGAAEAHGAYMAAWPALTQIELRDPASGTAPAPDTTPAPDTAPAPEAVTIAAWNLERCKRIGPSAALLRAAGADIVLATEMDWGMARSGQHHTTRDLAEALGMGYVYGVEFVELGTGDAYETGLFADVPNSHGLHGNAILSRLPLRGAALVPLDDGGAWYTASPKGDGQLRVGGRMAMAAQVDLAGGPVTLAAAHYESESTPQSRAAQSARLMAALDALYGDGPAVVGGDLNTAALVGLTPGQVLAATPEPSFAQFASGGYGWRGLNTGAPTTRAAPGKPVRYPLLRLDWLFARGVLGHSPRDWPAIGARGEYLSDHELITARFEHPAP